MDYLTDPRDKALLGQSPTLVVPLFGSLPPLAVGRHRYLLAKNGLFIEARSKALHVRLKLSDTPPMPYGNLDERVKMSGGLVPGSLYQTLLQKSREESPSECINRLE